jgi:hypothetical protein
VPGLGRATDALGAVVIGAQLLDPDPSLDQPRLPCFAGNEGRRTTTTDGLAICDPPCDGNRADFLS